MNRPEWFPESLYKKVLDHQLKPAHFHKIVVLASEEYERLRESGEETSSVTDFVTWIEKKYHENANAKPYKDLDQMVQSLKNMDADEYVKSDLKHGVLALDLIVKLAEQRKEEFKIELQK